MVGFLVDHPSQVVQISARFEKRHEICHYPERLQCFSDWPIPGGFFFWGGGVWLLPSIGPVGGKYSPEFNVFLQEIVICNPTRYKESSSFGGDNGGSFHFLTFCFYSSVVNNSIFVAFKHRWKCGTLNHKIQKHCKNSSIQCF